MTGDRAQAEALRIAHERLEKLEKLGWRYKHADIGKVAKEILDAMEARDGK